jgi:magnesium-transporting ATPase (P-type)
LGLDGAAAAARLKRFGPNRVATEHRTGIIYELVNRTRNPLNGLLLTLSVVSYFLGDARAAVIIASMVISISPPSSRSTVPTKPPPSCARSSRPLRA